MHRVVAIGATWLGGVFCVVGAPLVGVPLAAVGIAMLISADRREKQISRAWLEDRHDCQYTHFYRGSGIALDTVNGIIHLKDGASERTYPFADVRSWEGVVQRDHHSYSNAAQTVLAARAMLLESGFFVSGRDLRAARGEELAALAR